jgi:tetratricopeptide (TPR) repeat protein
VVIELYDVAVIPGVRRPMALGFKTDEIQRLITIEAEPKAIFEPLSVPDPASHAAHSGDVPRSPSMAAAGIGGQVPQFVPAGAGAAVRSAHPPRPVSEVVQAEYRRANELAKAGQFAEAIACYEEVLRQDPNHVNARINLGTSRHRLGDVEVALACYREALRVDPRSVRAHSNLASILRERGDLDGAISHCEVARQIEPGNAGLLHDLGTALCGAGRLGEAKSCLDQVLRANPRSATAHNSLGAVLLIEQKAADALPLFERAVEIQPSLGAAHVNLGNIFEGYGEVAKARAAYARALSIRDNPLLTLRRELICPPVLGGVEELDQYRKRAESVIDMFAGRDLGVTLSELQSTRAEAPFEWAYHGRHNLPLKRKYAGLFEGCFDPGPPRRRPQAEGPWHVGFVVTPTHEGIFLRCMAGIVDRLDRQRFRVSVACSRMSFDLVRRSLRNRELRLIDLPLRFDHAVARLRAAELDLIYFWEVGTDTTNYFLPFCRLAPVQCTGWGWPETSAAPALDVHLSSAALAPAGTERFFSETLVRLPHLPAYCVRPPVEAKAEPVERFGLRAGASPAGVG